MKNFLALFALIFSLNAMSENIQGLHCGTRGTMLGSIASDTLIPDYFPPEHFLLRLLLVNPLIDLSVCETELPRVNLGASCMVHDRCYRTLGATKDACDNDLRRDWLAQCAANYGTHTTTSDMCLGACNTIVELMNAGLRYNDGTFCPSCRAWERDQAEARRRGR